MMIKRIVAVAAVAGALAVSPLHAANTYCYTSGGFSACASAAITTNAGQTSLTVAIQNLSQTLGNTIYTVTSFGLYYVVPPVQTGSTTLFTGAPGWINGINTKILTSGPTVGVGQSAQWVGGTQAGNPATQGLLGCAPYPKNTTGISTCGGPQTFVFNLTAGSNFSLSNLNLAIRGQSWQSSTRPPAENFICYSTDPTCVVTSSVPEPATMGLLALGLVGMGGIGIARHRRKQA